MTTYAHLYDAAEHYPPFSLERFRIIRAATSHEYYTARWHATDGEEREGRRVEAWCAAIADAVREGGPVPGWWDVAAIGVNTTLE